MNTTSTGPRPEALDCRKDPPAAHLQPPVSSPQPDVHGLVCRHCGSRHFRVTYTWPAWGGRIVRRRECRHYGKRMIRWERSGG
jgi:hypothetical protein